MRARVPTLAGHPEGRVIEPVLSQLRERRERKECWGSVVTGGHLGASQGERALLVPNPGGPASQGGAELGGWGIRKEGMLDGLKPQSSGKGKAGKRRPWLTNFALGSFFPLIDL